MSRPSEIIVIGAGVIGCSIAYELARRGASVQVVDERSIGMGATQASAGILAPYVESAEAGPLLDLSVRSLHLFDGFIARVSSDSAAAVSYHRTGTLAVATDDGEARHLSLTAEMLAGQGVDAQYLDGQAARKEEPHLTSAVIGGLLIGSHGFVSAPELTRAIAAATRQHGAQLVQQSKVRRVARVKSDMTVETDHGSLRGDAVVLAAGCWSGSVDIEGVRTPLPVRPVRGQLLQLVWRGTPLRRVLWSSKCYLVPWDDGTVLVGATVEDVGFDERATVAGVHDLLDAACEITPHAWRAAFAGVRVGLRPGTKDNLPLIGPSRAVPNLIYATGHYRSGVILAPLTAQLVADLLLEGRFDEALDAVNPARFGEL